MGRMKELWISQQEVSNNHQDDDYQYQEWVSQQEETTESNNNESADWLDELFKILGEPYCPKSKAKEKRNI